MDLASVNEELAEIDGQIADIFRALQNGFQKLDKIKDANRRSRQLEELTDKMRDCKRLIKDFERVVKDETGDVDPNTARMLNDRKQSQIKELNSYVALKKQHASENKRVDLFDAPAEDGFGEENVLLASNMTNQQLMEQGNSLMDETDQALARSKQGPPWDLPPSHLSPTPAMEARNIVPPCVATSVLRRARHGSLPPASVPWFRAAAPTSSSSGIAHRTRISCCELESVVDDPVEVLAQRHRYCLRDDGTAVEDEQRCCRGSAELLPMAGADAADGAPRCYLRRAALLSTAGGVAAAGGRCCC